MSAQFTFWLLDYLSPRIWLLSINIWCVGRSTHPGVVRLRRRTGSWELPPPPSPQASKPNTFGSFKRPGFTSPRLAQESPPFRVRTPPGTRVLLLAETDMATLGPTLVFVGEGKLAQRGKEAHRMSPLGWGQSRDAGQPSDPSHWDLHVRTPSAAHVRGPCWALEGAPVAPDKLRHFGGFGVTAPRGPYAFLKHELTCRLSEASFPSRGRPPATPGPR